MAISFWLKYFYHALRHPGLADFVDKGIGIEARYSRYRDAWQEHLDQSKAAQREWLDEIFPVASLSILGAGRLYDVALDSFALKVPLIRFYDADPSAAPFWKRAMRSAPDGRAWEGHVIDLTYCLASWSRRLRAFLVSEQPDAERVPAFLDGLEPGPLSLPQADAVLSVNLLSQIPVFWRDRVRKMLRSWGRGLRQEEDGRFCPPIEEALSRSMAKLELQHLRMLSASNARAILLISDDDYFYEQGPSRRQGEPLLQHIPTMGPGYRPVRTWEWHWKLVPEKMEQEYGITHRVQAIEFKRV